MELKKRLVLLNVITSGAQVAFIGLIYFLLYRYLLLKLGVELLGVWSVVLSTSSLATLANFGISDSVIRFVALFSQEDNGIKMKQLIFTSTLFLTILFILIAAIIYPVAHLLLKNVLPIKYINEGLKILPYSLICLIINAISGVYASVLDGMQRNYIRNLIFSISSMVLLGLTYVLVPIYNLQGVAFAQIVQSGFTLVVCSVIVVIRLKYNPLKWGWNKIIFKQIFSYGLKFQFISLFTMINEPIIKILLSKLGGMAFVGYYEMANRLLSQARGVIINATQSLVPLMVNINKRDLAIFYKKVLSNVIYFSLTAICIVIISGRLISIYWIGHFEIIFNYTLLILAFSTFVNLSSGPAYFYYMAKAKLNVLVKNQLSVSLLNVTICSLLGFLWGGYGVILGGFFALLIGSVYLIVYFNKEHRLVFKSVIKLTDITYFLLLVSIVLAHILFFKLNYKIFDPIALLLTIVIGLFYFMKYKINDIRYG